MEFKILYAIQELRTPWLDALMEGISFLGNAGWIWIAVTAVFLCSRKRRVWGAVMAVSLVLHLLVCNLLLKNMVARPRPCWLDPSVELLIEVPQDYSFPSGHTAASFAVALILYRYEKRLGIAAFVLAALIAFSRMYLFVHFPTDILGGLLLGVGCAAGAVWAVRFWRRGRIVTDDVRLSGRANKREGK